VTLRLQRKVHKKVIDPMCADAITFSATKAAARNLKLCSRFF
jgi:hypothetical protein